MAAKILYRISGDPTPGYSTLLSEGNFISVGESKLKYSKYASQETAATYIAILGAEGCYYAMVMNPTRIRGFEGSRQAAFNLSIFIPAGYAIYTKDNVRVSPSQVLRELRAEFVSRFMRDYGNGSLAYKVNETAISNVDRNNPLVDWIDQHYELRPEKGRRVAMTQGADFAYVSCDSQTQLDELFMDLNYDELAPYSMLVAVEKGTDQTLSLTIPRPHYYNLEFFYLKGNQTLDIRQKPNVRDDERIVTPPPLVIQPYWEVHGYEFTVRDVIDGKNPGQNIAVDEADGKVKAIVPVTDRRYTILFKPLDDRGQMLDKETADALLGKLKLQVGTKIISISDWKAELVGDQIVNPTVFIEKNDDYSLVEQKINFDMSAPEQKIPLIFRKIERKRITFVISPKSKSDEVWSKMTVVSGSVSRLISCMSGNHYVLFQGDEIRQQWEVKLSSADYRLPRPVTFIPANAYDSKVDIEVEKTVSSSNYDTRIKKEQQSPAGNVMPSTWRVELPYMDNVEMCTVRFCRKHAAMTQNDFMPQFIEYSVDLRAPYTSNNGSEEISGSEGMLTGTFRLPAGYENHYGVGKIIIPGAKGLSYDFKSRIEIDKSGIPVFVITTVEEEELKPKKQKPALFSNKWVLLACGVVIVALFGVLCGWIGTLLAAPVEPQRSVRMTVVDWNYDEAKNRMNDMIFDPTSSQSVFSENLLKALDEALKNDTVRSADIVASIVASLVAGSNDNIDSDEAVTAETTASQPTGEQTTPGSGATIQTSAKDATAKANEALITEIRQTINGLYNRSPEAIMSNTFPEEVKKALTPLSERVAKSSLPNKQKLVKGIDYLYKGLTDSKIQVRAKKVRGGLKSGDIIKNLENNNLGK